MTKRRNLIQLLAVAAALGSLLVLYLLFWLRSSAHVTGRIGSDCTASSQTTGPDVGAYQGWISAIEPGLYAESKDRYDIYISLHDPFVEDSPTLNSLDEIDLCCFSTTEARALTVGQRIAACGQVRYVTTMLNGSLQGTIEAPVVNPAPFVEDLSKEPIPDDFRISYEDHGCGGGYTCPDFSVTIDSHGEVVYNGYSGARVGGRVKTQIDEEKVSELVTLVKRTQFLSHNTNWSTAQDNLRGSGVISVIMQGQQKTTGWTWGQSEPIPRKVGMIIAKVEEITNVCQWIRLWPELGGD